MMGTWFISGSIYVKSILKEAEVNHMLQIKGIDPMPWEGGNLNLEKLGF